MDASLAQLPLLTGAQLQNVLRIEFARARRYSFPLSCMAVLIDGLDRLREVHGSGLHDEVLRRILQTARGQSRTSDAAGFYQDRLVLILPHTAAEGAMAAALRLREAVAAEAFHTERADLRVTVSIGLSTFHDRGTIFYDSILKAAEAAVAAAHAKGGDRIEAAPIGPA